MKKLFLLLFFIIFWSCSQNPEKTIEKQTLIKSVPDYATIIDKKIYPADISFSQMMEKFLPKGSLYAGMGNGYVNVDASQVAQDKLNGKFYWENSHAVDPTTTILDLSSKVGGHKVCIVRLYIKIIDYGRLVGITGYPDGSSTPATMKFTTPDAGFVPITLTQRNGELYSFVDVITNSDGEVNVEFDITNPYDAITEAADPGVHLYQWIQAGIWVYAKWNVDLAE